MPLNLLLVILGVIIAYTYAESIRYGSIALMSLISLILVLLCITSPKLGFYLCILYGSIIYFIKRLLYPAYIPVSIGGEILIITLYTGILLRKIIKHEKLWNDVTNPITISLIVIIAYNLLELFNTYAQPPIGWAIVFPQYVTNLLFFLSGLYIMNSMKSIISFLKFWIIIAFIIGLYGCIQQWFGIAPWEYRQIINDPTSYAIMFQNGFIRKYSSLSDSPAFGILMSGSAIFSIALLLSSIQLRKKILLGIFIIIMLLGMAYSGTRTATAILPAGLGFMGLLTIQNKKILILLGAIFLIGIIFFFSPIHNGIINRLRSAFQFNSDPSMLVREHNRKSKQYYMHHHPIGGGIKTTGVAGLQFYPSHELAGFPPDGVFVMNALEIGWIGFLLQLFVYFIVLKYAIHQYYHQKNKDIKIIYAGIASTLFAWYISDYSQGAVGNFSISFIYYGLLAVIIKVNSLVPKNT
ncbi:MAG: hypothetical protein IMW88_02510 [Thermoflavifilum sp.]|uniref:O-antigen ligase family protein n=1 Tax=Thermoflavifilum sp. TaxID=1968839 RepID=UPI0018A3B911|nr:O-antigen ligase family protein [Thermoflavifilum sp.]QOR76446.1 MAG: hypothetical protein IMW88_02510 [Thermoflavifilum sp.]